MAIFDCLIAELVKAALENFKIPGLSAMFDGSALNIGGLIADSDRDNVIGSLKGLFGSGLSLGTKSCGSSPRTEVKFRRN